MQKLFNVWSALMAQLALAPAERDEKAMAQQLKEAKQFMESDEGKGLAGLPSRLAQLQKQIDDQAEASRKWQKMGLQIGADSVLTPRGRTERLEMLKDGRGFLSDKTAERFASLVLYRVAALRPGGMDMLSLRVREMAEGVIKDNQMGREKADFTPGTGTGSYLFADEFRPEIIRNVEAAGVLFPKCMRVPMPVPTVKLLRETTGFQAYWTSPATQPTHSAPVLAYVTLSAEKLFGLIYLANEYFRGATLADVGQWVSSGLAWYLSDMLDDALVNGDGSSTYGGITGFLQSSNFSTVAPVDDHDTLTEITAGDYDLAQAGLTKDYAMREAENIMSLSVLMTLKAIRTSSGYPALYNSSDTPGIPPNLNGFPIAVCQKMPAASACTTSAKYAAFGSLRRSHAVGMVHDLQFDVDASVGFLTDQTACRAILEGDIQEVDTSALVIPITHS
ncbi:MAG: phage major capsid protein [Lentisphaeria bacterium]